jgi:hypothetical protein
MVASKSTTPDETTNAADVPTLRFDKPWRKRLTVTRLKTANTTGMNGEPFSYPLLTVIDHQDNDTVKLIHAYPETLINELRRVKPGVGDEITVDYQGKKDTKTANRKAHIFEVDSPQAAAFDWDTPGF